MANKNTSPRRSRSPRKDSVALSAAASTGGGAAGVSPVPMEPVAVEIKTGPLRVRAQIEFDPTIAIDGPGKEAFTKNVRMFLGRSNAVATRLTELLLAQAITGKSAVSALVGCTNDLATMVKALEEFLGALVAGRDPESGVVTATASDLPPAAAAEKPKMRLVTDV